LGLSWNDIKLTLVVRKGRKSTCPSPGQEAKRPVLKLEGGVVRQPTTVDAVALISTKQDAAEHYAHLCAAGMSVEGAVSATIMEFFISKRPLTKAERQRGIEIAKQLGLDV
jgi:hypothetical protein